VHGELALRTFRRNQVKDGLRAGSLILIPPAFLPTTFLSFFRGGIVAAAFLLPARVLDDQTLGPADESSFDLALGTRVEIGMTKIVLSASKQGIGEVKLSRVCTITYARNEFSRNNLRFNGVLPYRLPFRSKMEGAHLISWGPTAGIVEHLL
jgi:hypothetical protein